MKRTRFGCTGATVACALLLTVSATAHAGTPARAAGYAITERIAAADGGWDFATVDVSRGQLYIARSDSVTAIDLATRKVTNALAPAQRGHQVLALDNGATVFETDGTTGLARFISATDGKVLAEVAVGTKPDAAFYDPATRLVAVMNAGDGRIALLDPKSRTLSGHIALGGALEFAVADGKGGAFVNIEDQNVIALVDLKDRKRSGTFELPGCDGPTGLALVAGGKRLISACANEVALVLDAVSGKVLARLAIGRDPDAVLYDAARGLAFIPCGGSGTLVALAITADGRVTAAGTIPTQVGAKTGAIDPRDGRIYLPTATLAPAQPGQKRGLPVPGSFVILVVSPRK